MSIGERTFQVIKTIDPSVENTKHFRARSAGRFIEEAVELALAYGLDPARIMLHVADAIHNECRKAGTFPSELGQATPDSQDERLTELADVTILIEHLASLSGIDRDAIRHMAEQKIEFLMGCAVRGEMKVIDGLMYRKTSR